MTSQFVDSSLLGTVTVVRAFGSHNLEGIFIVGAFVFGVSGGLAAARARLDIFGVLVLSATVGMAGGVLRDVLLGMRPSGLFDWRVLLSVFVAGILAFLFRIRFSTWTASIDTFDAIGLSLFCVIGTGVALEYNAGPIPAVVLGAITAVGGGVVRDILLRKVPEVLRQDLYAIPAILGSSVIAIGYELHQDQLWWYLLGAGICFVIRIFGMVFNVSLPRAEIPKEKNEA